MLRCLPLLKACNQQVDYVDKRRCGLASIPDDILQYRHSLEELLLDGNQIKELPLEFFNLVQLRKLALSDNEIFHLPNDIGNLVHLQELDMSRNDIEEIPENIKYCKNLQIIDFSSNPFKSLPDGFMHLQSLTYLSLNDASLNRIPYDIGSLTNLESLELRENVIKYLPSSISYLVKLRSLDLGSNVIDVLPGCIGCLSLLEELLLDGNELTELPWEIGNLKKLAELDLSDNKLECLPEEIGGLASLTDFILTHNHLEMLPHNIGHLKKLSILKVEQNLMVELTSEIGSCEKLQELLLTENCLTKLPVTIGKLKLLSNLNVDRNRLTEIPREMGNCSGMSVLSVRDNQIAQLPFELGNLTGLHVLDVCGNRLRNLPVTLSSCNLKAIWLSENQVQPNVKFQQEFDQVTGQMALTCFLLPQPNIHHMPSREFGSQPLLLSERSSSSDRGASWSHDSDCFNSSLQFSPENRLKDRERQLERRLDHQDAIQPKELRSNHLKLAQKVSYAQTPETVEDCFVLLAGDDNDNEVSPGSRNSDVSSGSKASTVKVLIDSPGHQTQWQTHQSPYRHHSERKKQFMNQQRQPKLGFRTSQDLPLDNEFIFEEEFEQNTSQLLNREDSLMRHHPVAAGKNNENFLMTDTEQCLSNVVTSPATRTRHVLSRQLRNYDSLEYNWSRVNSMQDASEPEVVKRNISFNEAADEFAIESSLAASGQKDKILQMNIVHDPNVPLGMSIIGGSQVNSEGIYISRLVPDGPSASAGLRAGDRILSINETDVDNMDHSSVVTLLRQPRSSITLTVARESETEAADIIQLRRDENGFGFTIAGGCGSVPFGRMDHSIYISRITEGGAAHLDGRLQVGDKLLSVNGIDMSLATHDDAVHVLTRAVGEITLAVLHENSSVPKLNLEDEFEPEEEIFTGGPKSPWKSPFLLERTCSVKSRCHFDVLPAIVERNSPISLLDGNQGDSSRHLDATEDNFSGFQKS